MSRMALRRGSMKAGVLTAVGFVVAVTMVIIAILIYRNQDPDPSGKFRPVAITIDKDVFKIISKPAGAGDGAEDVKGAVDRFYDAAEKVVQGRRTGAVRAEAPNLVDDILELYGLCHDQPDKPLPRDLPFTCAADLIASAAKGEFHYDKYLSADSMEWDPPGKLATAFDCLAQTAIVEGFLASKHGAPDRAESIYKAVLLYGYRLADTHVRVAIQIEGLDAQQEAAEALFRLWNGSEPKQRAEDVFQYCMAAERASKAVHEVYDPMFRPRDTWHPGDLLYFARKHPDPAWQVEAVLTIGMCRHGKGASQYEKFLMRCLNEKASDKNPYVSAAAAWSRNLTREDQVAQRKFKQQ